MRTTLRAAGAAALTAGLVLVGAGSASAHVTVTPDTTAAGAYALLTFGVPHGCDGSPTTRVSIQVPEQITTVTPTVNPGWEVEKVMAALPEPIDDGRGGQRTERVAEVVYTTTAPLPDGFRDAFVLSLQLPDAAGETLVFPVVQGCEEGETAWVQVPQDGQDPDQLALPAPVVAVTAADAQDEDAVAASVDATGEVTAGSRTAASTAEGDGTVATATADAATPVATWSAVALGAAGLLLGGVAFLRTRRTRG